MDEVESFLDKGDRILDAGCGGSEHQYTFSRLQMKFPEITGVDLDNTWNGDIMKQDLCDLEFDDGYFDVVLCMDVVKGRSLWFCHDLFPLIVYSSTQALRCSKNLRGL